MESGVNMRQRELWASRVDWDGFDWSQVRPGDRVVTPRGAVLTCKSIGPTSCTMSGGIRMEWPPNADGWWRDPVLTCVTMEGASPVFAAKWAPPEDLDDTGDGV